MDAGRLEAALDAAAAARGLDARTFFARVRVAPGGEVRVESSDAGLLAAAAAEAGGAVEAALLPGPGLAGRAAWVSASVADVRREPGHASEQVTQALLGETLEPLLHEDGWLLSRLADGYIGWVRDWHLRLVDPGAIRRFAAGARAWIGARWAVLRAGPEPGASGAGEALLGTPARVLERRADAVRLQLPAGRGGWVHARDVRERPWLPEAAAILATAQAFRGVPYVWGGRSPKGFDCSGLVQFVFGLHGVPLPRDADQQATCGVPVPEAAAGDLLFFGAPRATHVGIALGGGAFVHARGEVRTDALDPGDARHSEELRRLYVGARRVLPRAT